MNIDKAIKTQTAYLQDPVSVTQTDILKAIKLSIEALKREQHRRKYDIHLPVEVLPGETKD